MSTDPDLDRRLRLGLAHVADAVDPPIGDLLEQATARGRRRRSLRRAAILAVTLAIAAIPLGVLAVAHPFGGTDVNPAAPTRAALIGTWQTPSVPAADWQATYQRVGGSQAAARAFVGPPMGGPAATYRIVLRVTDTQWALYVSADGGDLEAGWHGPYDTDGSLVHVREATGLCEAAYRVVLSGEGLHISVVDDGCGDTDLLAQRTIYETADFQRQPG